MVGRTSLPGKEKKASRAGRGPRLPFLGPFLPASRLSLQGRNEPRTRGQRPSTAGRRRPRARTKKTRPRPKHRPSLGYRQRPVISARSTGGEISHTNDVQVYVHHQGPVAASFLASTTYDVLARAGKVQNRQETPCTRKRQEGPPWPRSTFQYVCALHPINKSPHSGTSLSRFTLADSQWPSCLAGYHTKTPEVEALLFSSLLHFIARQGFPVFSRRLRGRGKRGERGEGGERGP